MPWPFPRPVSKGSGRGPNRGFGWIPDSLPAGPSLSPSVNKPRSSGGFPYYPPTCEFTSGWETGYLAPWVSKGCLGVLPMNYPTLSLWARSKQSSTLSPEPYLSQLPFLTIGAASLLIPFLHSTCFSLHPTAFPFFLGSRRKGLTAQGHSLLGTACATETFPEPVSTPSGEIGRSHWP